MISDKHTAEEVSNRMLEVNRLLNEAASIVHETGTTAEFAAFRIVVARVLGELLFEVVNPLYQRHPDLAPQGMLVPKV